MITRIEDQNYKSSWGPSGITSQINCDRCGIIKPSGVDGINWYCNANDYKVNIFRVSDSEFYEDENIKHIDYCPNCLKSEHERHIASVSIGKYISKNLISRGFNIGRQLVKLIDKQKKHQDECLCVNKILEDLDPPFNKDRLFKNNSTAFSYSKVNFPTKERRHL